MVMQLRQLSQADEKEIYTILECVEGEGACQDKLRRLLTCLLEGEGLLEDHHLIYKLPAKDPLKPFWMAAHRWLRVNRDWYPKEVKNIGFFEYFRHWIHAQQFQTDHYDLSVLCQYTGGLPVYKAFNGKYLNKECSHVWVDHPVPKDRLPQNNAINY